MRGRLGVERGEALEFDRRRVGERVVFDRARIEAPRIVVAELVERDFVLALEFVDVRAVLVVDLLQLRRVVLARLVELRLEHAELRLRAAQTARQIVDFRLELRQLRRLLLHAIALAVDLLQLVLAASNKERRRELERVGPNVI